MKVGITGHQHLDKASDWDWVTDVMQKEISAYKRPLVAVSSLAIGADQVLANLVLREGGTLHAVLPYAGIERSFEEKDLPAYRDLAARADIEILETSGTDQDSYLAAGLRVVDLSDVLIAVWNGLPAGGKGGTADVVAYAEAQGKPLVHINPVTKSVKHLGLRPTMNPRRPPSPA